jgi:hypothetical protein
MNAGTFVEDASFEARQAFERTSCVNNESRDYERARLHCASTSFRGGLETQEFLFTPQDIAGSFNPSLSASAFAALRSLYASSRFDFSTKLCQRFGELLNLQPRWDGENAVAPKPEVLANVVSVLVFLKATLLNFREPFLTPTIDGFAQLEWRKEQRSLDIELTADGWSIVGSEITAGGGRLYHDAQCTRTDIDTLTLAYKWLDGAELLWPMA